jgi:hypothetical protein
MAKNQNGPRTLCRVLYFWDVTPYSLVEVYRHFGVTYRLLLHGRRVSQATGMTVSSCLLGLHVDRENGGNAFLRNVGELPDYTVSRHRRRPLFLVTAVGIPDLTAIWKDLWYRMLTKSD